MAPLDDKTLLVYGGIYEPVIESFGDDYEVNHQSGMMGFIEDDDGYGVPNKIAHVNQKPGGILYNT